MSDYPSTSRYVKAEDLLEVPPPLEDAGDSQPVQPSLCEIAPVEVNAVIKNDLATFAALPAASMTLSPVVQSSPVEQESGSIVLVNIEGQMKYMQVISPGVFKPVNLQFPVINTGINSFANVSSVDSSNISNNNSSSNISNNNSSSNISNNSSSNISNNSSSNISNNSSSNNTIHNTIVKKEHEIVDLASTDEEDELLIVSDNFVSNSASTSSNINHMHKSNSPIEVTKEVSAPIAVEEEFVLVPPVFVDTSAKKVDAFSQFLKNNSKSTPVKPAAPPKQPVVVAEDVVKPIPKTVAKKTAANPGNVTRNKDSESEAPIFERLKRKLKRNIQLDDDSSDSTSGARKIKRPAVATAPPVVAVTEEKSMDLLKARLAKVREERDGKISKLTNNTNNTNNNTNNNINFERNKPAETYYPDQEVSIYGPSTDNIAKNAASGAGATELRNELKLRVLTWNLSEVPEVTINPSNYTVEDEEEDSEEEIDEAMDDSLTRELRKKREIRHAQRAKERAELQSFREKAIKQAQDVRDELKRSALVNFNKKEEPLPHRYTYAVRNRFSNIVEYREYFLPLLLLDQHASFCTEFEKNVGMDHNQRFQPLSYSQVMRAAKASGMPEHSRMEYTNASQQPIVLKPMLGSKHSTFHATGIQDHLSTQSVLVTVSRVTMKKEGKDGSYKCFPDPQGDIVPEDNMIYSIMPEVGLYTIPERPHKDLFVSEYPPADMIVNGKPCYYQEHRGLVPLVHFLCFASKANQENHDAQSKGFGRQKSEGGGVTLQILVTDVVRLNSTRSEFSLNQPPVNTSQFLSQLRQAVSRRQTVRPTKTAVGHFNSDVIPMENQLRIRCVAVGSLTTILREYVALHAIGAFPIYKQVVDPKFKSKLITGGVDLWDKLPNMLTKHFASTLNSSQLTALRAALTGAADGGFTLLQGPPGTGKTKTVIALINGLHLSRFLEAYNVYVRKECFTVLCEILQRRFIDGQNPTKAAGWSTVSLTAYMDDLKSSIGIGVMPIARKPRILVCAPSNAGVDEIIERLMEVELKDGSLNAYRPNMVRLGNVDNMRENVRNAVSVTEKMRELLNLTPNQVQEQFSVLQETLGHIDSLLSKVLVPLRKYYQSHIDMFFPSRIASVTDAIQYVQAQDMDRRHTLAQVVPSEELGRELSRLVTLREDNTVLADRLREVHNLIEKLRGAAHAEPPGPDVPILQSYPRVLFSGLTKNLKESFQKEANIVFCTCSASDELGRELGSFDDLIVDEAAQCSEAVVLVALTRQVQHCILVGDPAQLPATVFLSNTHRNLNNVSLTERRIVATQGMLTPFGLAKAFERSLFERLHAGGHPVHMLTTQYRMHPHIASIISKRYYAGKLRDAQNVISRAERGIAWYLMSGAAPVTFFHVGSKLLLQSQSSTFASGLSSVNQSSLLHNKTKQDVGRIENTLYIDNLDCDVDYRVVDLAAASKVVMPLEGNPMLPFKEATVKSNPATSTTLRNIHTWQTGTEMDASWLTMPNNLRGTDLQFYNVMEALTITDQVYILTCTLGMDPSNIGIITFYQGQKTQLQHAMQTYKSKHAPEISLDDPKTKAVLAFLESQGSVYNHVDRALDALPDADKPAVNLNAVDIENTKNTVSVIPPIRYTHDPAHQTALSCYHTFDMQRGYYQPHPRENAARIHDRMTQVEVSTVDSFQGREKQVTIVSCVRTGSMQAKQMNANFAGVKLTQEYSRASSIGFLKDVRRINVALSRARDAMLVVGDIMTLCKNEEWRGVISNINQVANIIDTNGKSMIHDAEAVMAALVKVQSHYFSCDICERQGDVSNNSNNTQHHMHDPHPRDYNDRQYERYISDRQQQQQQYGGDGYHRRPYNNNNNNNNNNNRYDNNNNNHNNNRYDNSRSDNSRYDNSRSENKNDRYNNNNPTNNNRHMSQGPPPTVQGRLPPPPPPPPPRK